MRPWDPGTVSLNEGKEKIVTQSCHNGGTEVNETVKGFQQNEEVQETLGRIDTNRLI